MKENKLPGTLVLVNPEFINDRAGRRGDIGIVTYVDRPNDEVYLKFSDESEAVYPSDALFSLTSRDRLFADNGRSGNINSLTDYKDLYKISLLQDMGRSVDIWNALDIAKNNPGIWSSSLTSVADSLGQRRVMVASR